MEGETPSWSPALPQAQRHAYMVLLLVGFAWPSPLPRWRCALTAPLHPYLHGAGGYFLWHFPAGRPDRPLAGTIVP